LMYLAVTIFGKTILNKYQVVNKFFTPSNVN